MNSRLGHYPVRQNLSSDTLFHLTGSLEVLQLILQNGLQARTIYEKLPGRNLAYLCRTVCFCDIPLGMIKDHINWYGEYGIGIYRQVAKKHGFSPLHYIHSLSPGFPHGSSKKSAEWFSEYPMTPYLKQVRGKQRFYRGDTGAPYFKWKTFYNEREWRYFPADKQLEVVQYDLEEELIEQRKLGLERGHFEHIRLDPNDIAYIIIRDFNDLDALRKQLRKSPYKNSYDLLLTKVITSRQIVFDF